MEERLKHVVEKHLRLLALEETAEKEEQNDLYGKKSRQELQRKGVALYGLRVVERRTALGGKLLIQFAPPLGQASLPAHAIKVGDIVGMDQVNKTRTKCQEGAGEQLAGTVCKVKESLISVAFNDEGVIDSEEGWRMVKLANEVAFKRMRAALAKLCKISVRQSAYPIVQAVFDPSLPTIATKQDMENLYKSTGGGYYNSHLNTPQRRAVARCVSLSAPTISLIHGPPGTGKTETVVEIIKQLILPKLYPDSRSRRILCCGPSNLSVDNILERLAAFKGPCELKLVRVGHPARVLESVTQFTLDAQLAVSDGASLVKDIKSEIDQTIKQFGKPQTNRRELYGELKELRRELHSREKRAIDDIQGSAQVILSTLNMAGSRGLEDYEFDVVIIDEAGQALEAEGWIASLKAKRLIMAGDHCQLPPTVSCVEAEKGGLGVTLFERMVKRWPDAVSLLSIQYRMHEDIMTWASSEFYKGKLEADQLVAKHKLYDIPGVDMNEDTSPSMLLIDTAGFAYNEGLADDDESKYNEAEAKLIVKHLASLLNAGVSTRDIAIITPYNAQVSLIETLISEQLLDARGVEIGSVDGFQGREKEAVIISFVRSNEAKDIGFLRELRRTNVAITRARRQVCIICDSSTLESNPFYSRMIDYFSEKGELRFPEDSL